MPEGDTIYRMAVRLRPVMEGATVVSAQSRDPLIDANGLVDCRVLAVEARGKHLLMHLTAATIHSHMGMTGSWHVYQANERWQKSERAAGLALTLESEHASPLTVVVCFSPKLLEVLTSDALRRHRWLSKLGPDLLATNFDYEHAVRRFRTRNQTPIGEAIMDQTIVCGVGNVYKSETLFLERLSPMLAVEQLGDDRLARLLKLARGLMLRNLSGYPRQTRFGTGGTRVWVYGRGGERCLRCGERILVTRQGTLRRSSYWCPVCQALSGVCGFPK